jgi:hypothetical protein
MGLEEAVGWVVGDVAVVVDGAVVDFIMAVSALGGVAVVEDTSTTTSSDRRDFVDERIATADADT